MIAESRAEIDGYRRQLVEETVIQMARYRYNLEAGGSLGPFGAAGQSPEADTAELQAIIIDREQTLDALSRFRDFVNSGSEESKEILQQIEDLLSKQNVPLQSFFYSTWSENTRLTKPLS
jgi:hypothetical protein